MNRQTAFSNALACFHYLLSMYPDSIITFNQWCSEYEIDFHVELEKFRLKSIIDDLDKIRLAGSSVEINRSLGPNVHVIHIHWDWLD